MEGGGTSQTSSSTKITSARRRATHPRRRFAHGAWRIRPVCSGEHGKRTSRRASCWQTIPIVPLPGAYFSVRSKLRGVLWRWPTRFAIRVAFRLPFAPTTVLDTLEQTTRAYFTSSGSEVRTAAVFDFVPSSLQHRHRAHSLRSVRSRRSWISCATCPRPGRSPYAGTRRARQIYAVHAEKNGPVKKSHSARSTWRPAPSCMHHHRSHGHGAWSDT